MLSVAMLVAAACGKKFSKRNKKYVEYMDL